MKKVRIFLVSTLLLLSLALLLCACNGKQQPAPLDPVVKTVTYHYKNATENCTRQQEDIVESALSDLHLVVPKREHCVFKGWYADDKYSFQVTDESGAVIISQKQFLYDCGRSLYAKWESENTNVINVLMVYVTKYETDVKNWFNYVEHISYSMTKTERQICEILTKKVGEWLNDLGVATFNVESYFLKDPLLPDEIISQGGSDRYVSMDASNISELQGKLDDYQSVLLSASLKDKDINYYDFISSEYFTLTHRDGHVGAKYAFRFLDAVWEPLTRINKPLTDLLDESDKRWDDILSYYIRDYINTVQLRYNHNDFDDVFNAYTSDNAPTPNLSALEICRLFMLDQSYVDGKKKGLPYEVWSGETLKLNYKSSAGGYTSLVESGTYFTFSEEADVLSKDAKCFPDILMYAFVGDDAAEVQAVPMLGYEFVMWSDGVETAIRHDLNVRHNITVYAIFREKQ